MPKVEHDGPYLFDGEEAMYADYDGKHFKVSKKTVSKVIQVNAKIDDANGYTFAFEVALRSIVPKSTDTFLLPERLLAIADIEGNFIALYSWLRSNGAIDEAANWSFGEGHLVLVGDMMDRGDQVTQLLWLIYKLQGQAEKVGGMVHCLIGNHDAMNFHLDLRYVNDKYINLARQLSGKADPKESYRSIWNPSNHLYQWMKKWPSMISIGEILFVHAGASEDLVNENLSIAKINELSEEHIEENIYGGKDGNLHGNLHGNLITGRMGPWWYRGMVDDYTHEYKKMTALQIDRVLKHFAVKRVVLGHTVQDDVSLSFEDKVIMIDVLHGWKFHSGKTKGIRIENNKLYSADDTGLKTILLDQL